MSIINRCWKKTVPRANDVYAFAQQQFLFRESKEEGVFEVYDYDVHYKEEVFCCFFPTFFKDHLGRLVYRRSLYIKMWQLNTDDALKLIPNFSNIFKNLRQITDFTDRVVEVCLNDAKKALATSVWVPAILQEWLLLEYHVGHGYYNVQLWLKENDLTTNNLAELGKFSSFSIRYHY